MKTKTIDLMALTVAAMSGSYPPWVRVKHLVDPNSFKRLGEDDGFPLGIAIRKGTLPNGTTREELEQARSGDVSAWDRLKYFVLFQSEITPDGNSDAFGAALKHLNQFPELATALRPYEHIQHAKLLWCLGWALGEDTEEGRTRCRILAGNDQAVAFYFTYNACQIPKIIRHIRPELKRVALLKRLLDGDPMRVKEWSSRLGRYRRECADWQAILVLRHPEVAAVLQPEKRRWHARILKFIMVSPELTHERRQFFAQFPFVCAALL
jgi:hypothetical protein